MTLLFLLLGLIGSTGQIYPTYPPFPVSQPCADEGSRGPCYWDASERGNHIGQDFWVDKQQRVYYRFRDYDGHKGCWIHVDDTSLFVCEDGYRTTS